MKLKLLWLKTINWLGLYTKTQLDLVEQYATDGIVFAIDAQLEEYELGILPAPNGHGLIVGVRPNYEVSYTPTYQTVTVPVSVGAANDE